MIKVHTLLASVVIGSIIAGLVSQPAFAAAKPANGLSVSPAIENIQISPNQTSASFNESVTNISDNLLAVDISVKDFGAANAYGSIGFYGSSYKPSSNPHSLSNFINLTTDEYLLKPHNTQIITINLKNLNQLSPGGHYAALLFTPFIAKSGEATSQINLQPTVASLVFLTTPYGGVESIKLSGFSVAGFGFRLPSQAYILLTNTGNTQIIPRGVLSLKDPVAGVVAQTVINSDSGLVLPGTSRLYSVNIVSSNNLFKLPGLYQLQLRYRINDTSNYVSVTKNFFFLNPIVFVYVLIIYLIVVTVRRMYKKPKVSVKNRHRTHKS
jgi:hypothetical protein